MTVDDSLIDKLKKMDNADILMEIQKVYIINSTLEKINNLFQQISITIDNLDNLRKIYGSLIDKLNEQISSNYVFFTPEKQKQLANEAKGHLKQKLIEDFIKVETKYSDNFNLYERIDKTHYSDILEDILSEIF